jgi:hypothetical protein
MLKFVEAEDGYLSTKDVLFIYTMLAERVKEATDSKVPEMAEYELELWLKLQPAVLAMNGFDISLPSVDNH